MRGSLVVIEGLDGSGKGTQTRLAVKGLEITGRDVGQLSYPCYDSKASTLIKMYLGGDFGSDPGSVNPYAASSFYAADRFASLQNGWSNELEKGKSFVSDRYSTSNLIYQMVKLPKDEWDEFIRWNNDYEYSKIKLPKPGLVIFLDMPVSVSQTLLSGRYNGDETKKDIHENNVDFLNSCRESALYAAEKCGWQIIPCNNGNEPLSIPEIHSVVMKKILEVIE